MLVNENKPEFYVKKSKDAKFGVKCLYLRRPPPPPPPLFVMSRTDAQNGLYVIFNRVQILFWLLFKFELS